ncbi:MAG: hypothetical protein V1774_10775 [Candidatus Eisenbacteria bacterium]
MIRWRTIRRARAGRRAPAGGILALLLMAAAAAPAVSASALVPVETTFIWERAGWDPGSKAGGEVQESVALLCAGFDLGSRFEGQIEIARTAATRSGTHLEPAERAALLVRYFHGEAWLFQAGAGTPSRRNALERKERLLASALGDPLFGFPDPDAARGWRLHAGAVRGLPLSRATRLLFSLAGEAATAFTPAPEVSVDPADRVLAGVTLQLTGSSITGQARLNAAFEGSDRSNGTILRKGRRLIGLALASHASAGGAILSPALEIQFCERVSLLDPEIYDARIEGGPGSLVRLALDVGAERALDAPLLPSLRPSLTLAYVRVQPNGLATADGWSARIVPQLAFETPAGEIELSGGWGRGSWSDWETAGHRPSVGVDGWLLRLAWTRRWINE